MHTDRCGDTGQQEFHAQEAEETLQCKSPCIGDAAIVESEMCDYNSYNWNHLKVNESLKKHLTKILEKHSIDS
jgi:hypothetical protein